VEGMQQCQKATEAHRANRGGWQTVSVSHIHYEIQQCYGSMRGLREGESSRQVFGATYTGNGMKKSDRYIAAHTRDMSQPCFRGGKIWDRRRRGVAEGMEGGGGRQEDREEGMSVQGATT